MKPTKRQSDNLRQTMIKSARSIATRFIKCAEGDESINITSVQYKCGAKILDKCVSDLKSVEQTNPNEGRSREEIEQSLMNALKNPETRQKLREYLDQDIKIPDSTHEETPSRTEH